MRNKNYHDKKKNNRAMEYIITKPVPQRILKEILCTEEKDKRTQEVTGVGRLNIIRTAWKEKHPRIN